MAGTQTSLPAGGKKSLQSRHRSVERS